MIFEHIESVKNVDAKTKYNNIKLRYTGLKYISTRSCKIWKSDCGRYTKTYINHVSYFMEFGALLPHRKESVKYLPS